MGTEVEPASGDIQTNVTTHSTTTSTSGPKMSMFAKRSGFVIPKNKLSGSLVPIYRGPKKGDADSVNEEATNQALRKTKWGPDLTLDTTVRKGRASAYQTRISQISQQLNLGTLAPEGSDESLATSDHQLSKEESELLELERREIIGEVLKLNPTYKAPADYKPLVKEAKVPIPIKEYPGYNFIGLVFGPANDTQKRLEKETGAKIQVYGTKSDTGGKVEVTPSDGKEINDAYEDLYVHVSADTFEKIDAAVALIELLLTSVSVNPVSSSTSTLVSDINVNTHQNTPSSITAPAPINQGAPQPYPGPLPPPQVQLPQYPQTWFPMNPTHAPTYFQTPANSSAPLLNNTVQVSSSPFNPTTTMPSLFGPRPIMGSSFSPVLQNPSVFPSRPQNASQPSYMQQAPPLGQTGGPRNIPGPSLAGPPPIVPSHGHNAMASQNTVVSRAPQVNIPNNMIAPPLFGLSRPETARPMPQAIRAPSPNDIRGAPSTMPFPQSSSALNNNFGGAQNFDAVKPISASISRPSSGDFTFQPHNRQPHPASQVWQSNQPTHHHARPPVQAGPGPLVPQPPMLRPMTGNLNPSDFQSFPRPQINRPVNQPMNFAGNPTGPLPSRHPILPTGSHMQPRNFIPPQPLNNSPGLFPPRPGPQMHIPENHFRPQPRFSTPHPQFGNVPGWPFSSSSGAQQVYDPFSPTSVPFNPQMGGGKARVHNENDPEYEDLMASVGVQ